MMQDCNEPRVHVGNSLTYKVQITENCLPYNLAGATTKNIIAVLSNGTKITKTASFLTDGTDGWLYCVFTPAELSVAGEMKLQAYVVVGLDTTYSDVDMIMIYQNI
jgi:hypothetical protein